MRNAFAPYEKQFHDWASDSTYPKVKPATAEFLDHLLDPDRQRPFWPGQREGLLRVVYAYEILDKRNLLLNIVTGGGKTAIIAACIAWLRWVHGVRSFLLLCPNTIVRDRLRDDFEAAKVFHEFQVFPSLHSHYVNDLGLHVMEPGSAPQGVLESGVVLANIQQLYGKGSNEKLAYILNFLGELAVFNDEAHNTPAPEYTDVLKALSAKQVFRLDTTATPDRADGQEPDSEMIYEYGIPAALDDGIIKSTVVYQPDIESVELTYTDPDTGKKASVDEINWEEIDERRVKATKWVTDPEPRRKQLRIARARLEEQKKRAKGRYKPILFVVSVGISDAKETQRELERTFGIKALVVTEESSEEDRREALQLGHRDSPYEAVVSVLMLREGWDVPEVSVIALLRKFSSHVYGQQVIGRGLRKVIRQAGEREILCAVDHPKLNHEWLWDLVRAKVKKGVKPGQEFDPEADLPERMAPEEAELVRPDKLIEIPESEEPSDEEFDFTDLLGDVPDEEEARKDWPELLAAVSYAHDAVEITKVVLKGVKSISLDPTGFVKLKAEAGDANLGDEVPEITEEDLPPTEQLADQLKHDVLSVVEELLFEKGFAGTHRSEVYRAMMDHVDEKLLEGKGLASSTKFRLLYAIHKLPEVRDAFMRPGIVAGIVKFPLAHELAT